MTSSQLKAAAANRKVVAMSIELTHNLQIAELDYQLSHCQKDRDYHTTVGAGCSVEICSAAELMEVTAAGKFISTDNSGELGSSSTAEKGVPCNFIHGDGL